MKPIKLHKIIDGKKYDGCVRFRRKDLAEMYANTTRVCGYYVRIIKGYAPSRIIDQNSDKVAIYEVWSRRITKEDNKMKPKKFNNEIRKILESVDILPNGCEGMNCERCLLHFGVPHPEVCKLLKSKIPVYKS